MATFAAFYDANVLYPAELGSFLMHLAMTGLFRAKWSNAVHEEWISNLLLNRPDLTRETLERTRMLMDRYATEALVTGYEHLITGLHLPDPKDRHLLAAIPDEFILHLLGLAPGIIVAAAQTHRLSMKNPSKSGREYWNYWNGKA